MSAAAPSAGSGGSKRPRSAGDDEALRLTAASSTTEVGEWLSLMVPAFEGRDAALASCAHLDGAKLIALTEADMRGLGFKAFGVRRKLTLAIKEMVASAEQQATGGSAAPPATTPGTVPKGAVAAASASAAAAAAASDDNGRAQPVNLDHAAVEAQLNAEASCIGVCQWSAKTLQATISGQQYQDWASAPMKRGREAALGELSGKLAVPGASVVVVGNTGAGKSTLLNALIGESSVLPTNGMRACTAVIIELSYNHEERGAKYGGVVEFISQQEWDNELEDLLGDLTTQEGRAILHVNDPEAHNYDSWCKMYAVYGDHYTHSSVDTGEVANGRKVYKALMVDDLKRKLKVSQPACGSRFLSHLVAVGWSILTPDGCGWWRAEYPQRHSQAGHAGARCGKRRPRVPPQAGALHGLRQ